MYGDHGHTMPKPAITDYKKLHLNYFITAIIEQKDILPQLQAKSKLVDIRKLNHGDRNPQN